MRKLTSSDIALLASNTLPLIGVTFWGWSVFETILLFWLENVIIGLINVLKMVTSLVLRRDLSGITVIPFFIFHYGIFAAVHGAFVISMFGKGMIEGESALVLLSFIASHQELIYAAIGLSASHLFSFVVNFLNTGEARVTDPKKLMSAPYGRVIVLHLTILIGGGFVMMTGEQRWALVLLVVLKIAVDLVTHKVIHSKKPETPVQL